jgi:tRNA(fMet)-specific endonuclease VapC
MPEATLEQRMTALIATMDLRIASIALCQGLTSLTRNSRDFSRVPGLVVEDWTI